MLSLSSPNYKNIKYIKQTYFSAVLKDFDFFFSHLTNKFIFRAGFIWHRHLISNFVYFSFFFKKYTTYFQFDFFYNLKSLFFFRRLLIAFELKRVGGFFYELLLVGLGYRIRYITKDLFRFFWGYATFLYLVVPNTLRVCTSEDSKAITFFSNDPGILYSFVSSLVLMKKVSVYRLVGLIKPTTFVRLKAGKQR